MTANYIRVPFATSGDRTAVPVETQGDGSISFTQGWGNNYQLDQANDPNALDVDRRETNQVLNIMSAAIQELQQQGVADYITATNNGGTAFSYGRGVEVLYDAGSGKRKYESLIDNNTNLPTVTSAWRLSDFGGLDARYPLLSNTGTAAQLDSGQDNGDVALIGNPAVAGNTSVIVNSGSSSSGFYVMFSNGLIMQWGSAGQNGIISFPIPFTNVTSVSLTSQHLNAFASGRINTGNISTTGFTKNSDVSADPCFWNAIGY